MMQTIAVPTADKDLPSFLHPHYIEQQGDLQLVWDVWSELKDCAAKYLPQEEKEPPRAYTNRLKRTQFDSRFAPALKGHAGLLSDFTLTDPPNSIALYEDDIDQQGNTLKVFLAEADEMVLRDGGCGILVEFPPDPIDPDTGSPLIQSAADEQAFQLRPYLVAIDRRDILNWSVSYKQGKPFIDRVVIRESHLVPDGLFGTKTQVLYRVLTPGKFEVYEIRQVNKQWVAVLLPEKSGFTSLDRVPLLWYSVSKCKLFEGQPPFLNLAKLNIEHYQKRSSLNEVLHKCNLPVPVRRGFISGLKDLINNMIPRLVIGPNSIVDVPEKGDFFFAEPTGNAIAATQTDILKLESSMDRTNLAFLTGGEGGEKTATEVIINTAQIQASVSGMTARKRSCVEQAFEIWTEYTGEDAGGSIEIGARVLQVPPSPQEIQTILDAMGIKIGNRLGLEMLLQRGWLPAGTDIDEQMRLLEGEMTPPEPAIDPIDPTTDPLDGEL